MKKYHIIVDTSVKLFNRKRTLHDKLRYKLPSKKLRFFFFKTFIIITCSFKQKPLYLTVDKKGQSNRIKFIKKFKMYVNHFKCFSKIPGNCSLYSCM